MNELNSPVEKLPYIPIFNIRKTNRDYICLSLYEQKTPLFS